MPIILHNTTPSICVHRALFHPWRSPGFRDGASTQHGLFSALYGRVRQCPDSYLFSQPWPARISCTFRFCSRAYSLVGRPNASFSRTFFEEPLQDVRTQLRSWLAHRAPTTVASTTLPGLEMPSGNLRNNLTRPEDLAAEVAAEQQEWSEAPDENHIAFDSIASPDDEAYISEMSLRVGDLVQLDLVSAFPVLAIFLGISELGVYQYFTSSGRFCYTRRTCVLMKGKTFATADEVHSLTPFLSREPFLNGELERRQHIPQNLALPLLRKFTLFNEAMDEFYTAYAHWLDNAHERMAHETDVRFCTVDNIAKDLIPESALSEDESPPHVLFSILNALIKQTVGFTFASKTTNSTDRVLMIYSKNDVRALKRVQAQTRAFQEKAALEVGGFPVPKSVTSLSRPLDLFILKAQKLIDRDAQIVRCASDGTILSRAITSSEDTVLDGIDEPPVVFSKDDSDIIRVLKLQAFSPALSEHPMLTCIPLVITRALSNSDEHIPAEILLLRLLTQLGVIDASCFPRAFDRDIWPTTSINAELSAIESLVKSGKPVDEVLEFSDSMVDIRKNWGETPVFCIDSSSTRDIDDGISIETISGSPGIFWIHVHVAHLSAFTGPESLLGRLAKDRLSSQYFTAGAYLMFPQWITQMSSLGPDKPVLTFSAKVDSNGNMLDFTVTPGTIHNVKYITPDYVDTEIFGIESIKEHDQEWTAQRVPGEESCGECVTPSQSEKWAISTLFELTTAIYERQPGTPFHIVMNKTRSSAHSLTVDVGQSLPYVGIDASPGRPNLTRHDPKFILQTTSPESKLGNGHLQSPSRILVEQSMILAGIVAARWSHARGVPIIFTGSTVAVQELNHVIQGLREKLEGSTSDRGLLRQLATTYGRAWMDSSPLFHKFLGTSHWCRATSPLRRYLDLVTHWQIDATLRREADIRTSLVGNIRQDFLPFSRWALDNIIREARSRLTQQRAYVRRERVHWKMHFLARALYLSEETTLPDPLTCLIGPSTEQSNTDFFHANLVQIDVKCLVRRNSTGRDGQPALPGETWNVELKEVLFARSQVIVAPLTRIKPADEIWAA